MKLFGIFQCIHPSAVAQIKKLNNQCSQVNPYDPFHSLLVSQKDNNSDDQNLKQEIHYQLDREQSQGLNCQFEYGLEQQMDQEQPIQSKSQSTPGNWFQESILQPNTEYSEWGSISPCENEAIQGMSTPGFTGFSCDTSQNIYDTRSPFNLHDATPTTTATTITPRCQQGFSQKGLKLDPDDDCLTVSAEQNYQKQLPAFGTQYTLQNDGIKANTAGKTSRQRIVGQLRKGSFCMLREDTEETNQGFNQNAVQQGDIEKQKQKEDGSKQGILIRQKLSKIQKNLKTMINLETTASDSRYPKLQNNPNRVTSSLTQLEDLTIQMKKIIVAATKTYQSLPIIYSSLNALKFQLLHRLFQKFQQQLSKQSSQSLKDKIKKLSLKAQKTYNLSFQDLSGSLEQSCKNITNDMSANRQFHQGILQQLYEITKELSLPRDLNQLFTATSSIIDHLSILQSCGTLLSIKSDLSNKLSINKVIKSSNNQEKSQENQEQSSQSGKHLKVESNQIQEQQEVSSYSELEIYDPPISILSQTESKINKISILDFN